MSASYIAVKVTQELLASTTGIWKRPLSSRFDTKLLPFKYW
jgi:hypothetical protein